MTTQEQLRVGLIGAGGMGRSLAETAAGLDNCTIAFLYEPVREQAEQAAVTLCAEACPSLEDLLARDDLDAVIVAAPNHLHAELTIAAAMAGKHVFCEKPMALNVADARQMIAAAQANKVKLMVGQVLRYMAPFAWMDDFIAAGEMGEPVGMQITRIAGPWRGVHRQPWRMAKEKCGGPLFEIAQHEIDFMRQILGEATSVYARLERFVNDEIDYEDYASVMISFEQNRIGYLLQGHASYLGLHDGQIFCTEGTISFDCGRGEVIYQRKADEESTALTQADIAQDYEPALQRELREFVEAVLNDTEPPIPGTEGLRNVEVAEAAHLSQQQGQPVQLPLES